MANSKRLKTSVPVIHEILPLEVFQKMILKKLGYKSIKVARGVCQTWKKVIDDFKLVENALCKLKLNFESEF